MQKVADRVGYILSNIDTEYLIEIRDAAFLLGIAIDSRLKKQQQIIKETPKMKIRKTSSIVFFAATLIVFFAGTLFTALHRWNSDAAVFSKWNILAIAAGAFLTIGEIAFIFIHSLLDARELWRRIAAYVLSLMLISTITYAACTEAYAFMQEGNISTKQKAISALSKDQQSSATTRQEKTAAIYASQKTLKDVLDGATMPDFTPFAVNFFCGLFCIVTGTLIQPREPWRRRGNVMNDRVRQAAVKKIGFLEDGATAYYDGKNSSIVVKNGREYRTTLSKKEIE